jgi:hypothetical protein
LTPFDELLGSVGDPMSREEVLASEGTGWAGDLSEMRSRDEIPGL